MDKSVKVNFHAASLVYIQGNVTMFRYDKEEKKYVKVKCDVFFGSCVYDDVCALLALITQCPDPLTKIGIDCHCPIRKVC